MDTSNPLDIMSRTVYGEARGEGKDGWVAVAWVIKNRASKPGWWGHDVISVCLKPMQFDCWNSNDPNSSAVASVDSSNSVFAAITAVCDDVINGTIPDPTHGATYYYVTGMHHPPAWANGKTPCAVIGHQSFFNNIG